MKICLVTTQLGMGGAETQVCALADRFVALGHSVAIISLMGEPVVTPDRAEVKILSLLINKKQPVSLIRGIRTTRNFIRGFKPDIVHSHEMYANVYTRVLRHIIGYRKLITTLHNTAIEPGLVSRIFKFTNHISDLTTNVSNEATENYINNRMIRRSQIKTVYNGIDLEKYRCYGGERDSTRKSLGIKDEDYIFLAAGRLMPQKDYGNLLSALYILKMSGDLPKDWKLLIVGSGYLRDQLEAQSNDLGLFNNVVFMGVRKDLKSIMCAADMFVLSSAWEGLPLVIAEAMACENTIVATDCGGVRELMGATGLVCQSKSPQALADGIKKSISLPEQAKRLNGFSARKRIESSFSISSVADEWIRIYEGI